MSTASVASDKKTVPEAEPEHKYGWREQVDFLKAFWVAPSEKAKARWMLAGIVGLTVAEIALTAGVGFGFKLALDALVAKNAAAFALSGAGVVGGLVGQSVAGNGREYMQLNLSQNWRGWLTRQFNDKWLSGKTYLRLQHNKKYTQNPDQRIAETIGNVTGTTLSLGLGLMRSVVGAVVFAVVLWHIAPVMVVAAGGCALVAHGATHWAGGSMRKIWRSLMDTEAKFRHALTRVRDNAKPIALGGLEPVEKKVLTEEFNTLDEKRREFYKFNWRMGMVGSLNWSTASVVPIALSAPKFFAGAATLGSLELTRQAYGQFYQAISWFPQGYTQIAGWQANVSQLMDFKRDLEENKADITAKKTAEPAPPAPTPAIKAPQPKAPAGPAP